MARALELRACLPTAEAGVTGSEVFIAVTTWIGTLVFLLSREMLIGDSKHKSSIRVGCCAEVNFATTTTPYR